MKIYGYATKKEFVEKLPRELIISETEYSKLTSKVARYSNLLINIRQLMIDNLPDDVKLSRIRKICDSYLNIPEGDNK